MQIKLKDIVEVGMFDATKNEKSILANLMDVKMPIKYSYSLNKLSKQVALEVELFNTKKREMIIELGEKPDSTVDSYNVKPENMSEFIKRFNELCEIEVELDFTPLKLEELTNTTIEPKYMVSWLFEDTKHPA